MAVDQVSVFTANLNSNTNPNPNILVVAKPAWVPTPTANRGKAGLSTDLYH